MSFSSVIRVSREDLCSPHELQEHNAAEIDMMIENIPLHVQGRHLMNRADAARYLKNKFGVRCTASSLAARARRGDGPVFRRFESENLYSYRDLDAWIFEGLSEPLTSTPIHGEPAAA